MMASVPQLDPAPQNLVDEALEDAAALARVRHLGVELQAVEPAGLVGHAGDGRGL